MSFTKRQKEILADEARLIAEFNTNAPDENGWERQTLVIYVTHYHDNGRNGRGCNVWLCPVYYRGERKWMVADVTMSSFSQSEPDAIYRARQIAEALMGLGVARDLIRIQWTDVHPRSMVCMEHTP